MADAIEALGKAYEAKIELLQRQNAEAHQRAEDAIAVSLRTSTELSDVRESFFASNREIARLEAKLAAAEAALTKLREYNVAIMNDQINYRPADHIQVIDAAKTEVQACPDCERAKKLAWSEFTTPGFFYTECDKHRAARGDKP